ncbi:hypothetical protein NEOKW01_0223 [Nematocida sp. AWRm80]|nr:hypothetical protein NEOKW01_0223 [Nematocida sp. AWRm80]
MQLGFSLEALAAKKNKNNTKENSSKVERTSQKEKNINSNTTKKTKKKLPRKEQIALLDRASVKTLEQIAPITETDKKEILKMVVNALNTVPIEHHKIVVKMDPPAQKNPSKPYDRKHPFYKDGNTYPRRVKRQTKNNDSDDD